MTKPFKPGTTIVKGEVAMADNEALSLRLLRVAAPDGREAVGIEMKIAAIYAENPDVVRMLAKILHDVALKMDRDCERFKGMLPGEVISVPHGDLDDDEDTDPGTGSSNGGLVH